MAFSNHPQLSDIFCYLLNGFNLLKKLYMSEYDAISILASVKVKCYHFFMWLFFHTKFFNLGQNKCLTGGKQRSFFSGNRWMNVFKCIIWHDRLPVYLTGLVHTGVQVSIISRERNKIILSLPALPKTRFRWNLAFVDHCSHLPPVIYQEHSIAHEHNSEKIGNSRHLMQESA